MTKQSLDERIYAMQKEWFGEPVLLVEDQIKQLIRDVLTEVLPEKVEVMKRTASEPYISLETIAIREAANVAIDQFTTNLNNLLGEKQ